ncbi:MAG: alpha/beta fold hydrolase [Planctomycetaceae bacterium]|nr:alpha/beta fold hydrolase [Planctomycetaceae bacterium]
MSAPKIHFTGSKRAKVCLVLAHGAGEGWDSKFLTYFADGISKNRVRVARFEFPYMADRSRTGRKRPPDKSEVLEACWRDVIAALPQENIVIGGKSMGGRIATMVADEQQVAGVVCLGYPFHATGKPEKTRVEHLADLQTPTLIVQGEIDPFGTRPEVEGYHLSDSIQVHWVPEGDHSYHVKRGSERSVDQNMKNALRAVEKFLFELFPELTI